MLKKLPSKRGARPDKIDIMRTYVAVIAGGLLGIFLIGTLYLLLQNQSFPRAVPATATPQSRTPTPGAGSDSNQEGRSDRDRNASATVELRTHEIM